MLEQQDGPVLDLSSLPEVQKIIKKQKYQGFWRSSSSSRNKYPAVNYDLIESWKQMRFLVEQFELDKNHEAVRNGAEYIFSCQTAEGDIRGIIGNQYAFYYTGAIAALLNKAGYEDDPRVEKAIQWLISKTQRDGGWVANALMTLDFLSWKEVCDLTSQDRATVVEHDRDKPFCINGTGMVLRAFATHNRFRRHHEAVKSAELLKSHFFMENYYSSYKDKDSWLVFQFPYWWNNLIAALDSISRILPSRGDKDIRQAVDWLKACQEEDGLWRCSYSKKHKNRDMEKYREERLWISLAVCRILRRILC